MKRIVVIALIIIAVIIITIIALALHFVLGSAAVPSERKKVVVYAYRDAITGIDPGIEFDTGLVILGVVYEPLLYYNPLTNEFKPGLAIQWKKINDTAWIFILRKDAVFHDGIRVTAEAVKFSIERTKTIYDQTGIGPGYIWDPIEKIIVLNETAIVFKLKYPAPLDLIAASSYGAYIYSPKVLEYANAENITDERIRQWFEKGNDVGSGPYRIVKYEPESEIILEKFDKWWGWKEVNNPNAPDTVIIKIIETPESQELGLRTKEIDIASSVPRANIDKLKKEGFAVKLQNTYHNFILMLNTKRWPTNITEVRKAIAYAIPWNQLIENALYGYGRLASGIIPYGYPGHLDNLTYEYSLEKARNFLKQAGIWGKDIKLEIVITSGYEEEENFAQLLRSSLAQLGIDLEIIAVPWEQVREYGESIWKNPEEAPHMIINDWWPTYPTPYDYLYLLYCDDIEWNWAGYCNNEYDELIDKAWELEGINYDKAIELYTKAQALLFRDVPAIGLWDDVQPYIYNPNKIRFREEAFNPLYMYVI
ncbi:MAG TPA: ABC transporter substrate-binding protein, partial [Ignisphaera sp.]|nr:ABC transporter substrate-binding protein [Ignisphaera sp.]